MCGTGWAPFDSVAISANPAGLPITNLNSTIDGTYGADLSGFSPPVSEAQLTANQTTGFLYSFTTPRDNVVRLRWYNGGGGILTDQDGFGLITVAILDPSNTVLSQFTWDLTAPIGNNAVVRQMDFAPVSNVARVRVDNFHKQNTGVFGTGSPLLRQFEVHTRGPVFPCRRAGTTTWYNTDGNLADTSSVGACS